MDKPIAPELPISIRTTPYFYDPRAAVALLRAIRWPSGLYCPRCGSSDVREVETSRIVEALSCRECRYNFTTAADTHFHGSRIPLTEQLHFITAVALEPESSASRFARFFQWKTTTVGRHLSKLNGIRDGEFVRRLDSYRTFESFSSVIEYLEQPAIVIRPDAFEERVGQLLTTHGRKLRRANRSTISPKSKLQPMTSEKFSPSPRGASFVSPQSLPYLSDGPAAHDLVDSLRWDNNKRTCPRCSSRFVLPVRRKMLRELHRCVDCHYIFNSLAGTIFQGTKMPINKYLQFFIIYNALGEQITMQDICYALGCSFKTAALWLERGRDFKSPEQFAFPNMRVSAGDKSANQNAQAAMEPFFSFCEMKGIVVNEAHLLEYAKGVCRATIDPNPQ